MANKRKPITLQGLSADDALRAAMQVKPEPKRKPKKRKPAKRKK